MPYIAKDQARVCDLQPGEALADVAARETAAGNPLTEAALARYNWGIDDPVEVEILMRDRLGCRARRPGGRFVVAEDDTPDATLHIPEPFEAGPMALNRTYELRVRRTPALPPQRLGCCSLPGVTFRLDSSFVQPTVASHLQALEALATQHPTAKIQIFGHADAVGDALYNKKLSERRAWSVYAFLTNDVDAWETLYDHPDETWGLAVVQEILAHLGHDPGPLDSDWGPQTRAAMRAFLELPDDAAVQNDGAFRQQLFAAYMAHVHDIDLPPERFLAPGYMGCGEFNRLEETEGAFADNRRVTFFLFHPDRLPTLPCAFADTAPCQRQMVTPEHHYTPSFRCSFYDSLARDYPAEATAVVRIRLFDPEHQPIAHAPCTLEIGPASYTLVADADGYVETQVLGVPARGVVRWGWLTGAAPEDFPDDDADAVYPFERTLHFDYDSGDDPDAEARWRLHHLGYPVLLDEPLTDQPIALLTFQYDHLERYDLALTGELDDATRAALADLHDACEPLEDI